MREVDMTTSCSIQDSVDRDRLYVHGQSTYVDNSHKSVLEAVDRALAKLGLEIVYGFQPGDDDYISVIVLEIKEE